MATRTCRTCGETKPVSAFPPKHDRWHCRECMNTRLRAWFKKNPLRRRAATKRAVERHGHKMRARKALNNAIRSGLIVRQPCQLCGATTKTEGHHKDYSRPLDVDWLCNPCHRRHLHWRDKVARLTRELAHAQAELDRTWAEIQSRRA